MHPIDLATAPKTLRNLAKSLETGGISKSEFWRRLAGMSQESMGFATLDHGRETRKGFPEVVFGEGKTLSQLFAITPRLLKRSGRVLITRLTEAKASALIKKFPMLRWNTTARCLHFPHHTSLVYKRGRILILAAGTSDLPVVEEAKLTASLMGCRVQIFADVGVAGLSRLLVRLPEMRQATVLIVAAGMEAALPSVIAGLVHKPVIALPTSIGYGTGAKGYAALLSMLNSCAPGLLAVNIDNGFGAGYAAAQIIWALHRKR